MLTPREKRIVAHRLCINPEDLDEQALAGAVDAVERRTVDAFDAMAEVDQMIDNLDRCTAIAIVYDYI
jgi:hypothetical protein